MKTPAVVKAFLVDHLGF